MVKYAIVWRVYPQTLENLTSNVLIVDENNSIKDIFTEIFGKYSEDSILNIKSELITVKDIRKNNEDSSR